jgi:hypothetical protein
MKTIFLDGEAQHIELQPHQKDLVQSFSRHDAIYAYHDTGTGKTFAALACICDQLEKNLDAIALIVAPSVVVPQWKHIITHQILPFHHVTERISVLSHGEFFKLVQEHGWSREQYINSHTDRQHISVTNIFFQKSHTLSVPFLHDNKRFINKTIRLPHDLVLVIDEVQEQFKNTPTLQLSTDAKNQTSPLAIPRNRESIELENNYGWTLRFACTYWCSKALFLSATPFVDSYADLLNPLNCLRIVESKSQQRTSTLETYMTYTLVVESYEYTVPRSGGVKQLKCRISREKENRPHFEQNPLFGGVVLTEQKLSDDIANHRMNDYAYLFHRMKRHPFHPCYPRVYFKDMNIAVDPKSLYSTVYSSMVQKKMLTTTRTGGKPNSDFYESERLNQLCIFDHETTKSRVKWTLPRLQSLSPLNPSFASPQYKKKIGYPLSTTTELCGAVDPSFSFPRLIMSPICEKIAEKLSERFTRSVIFTQSLEVQYYCSQILRSLIRIPYKVCILNDEKRREKIQEFNTTDVAHGGIVLFISKSGSSGVDLKQTHAIFLVDLPFSYMEKQQIIGRGQRFRSHIQLTEQQSYVCVYTVFLRDERGELRFANELIHEIVEEKRKKEEMFVSAIEKACGISIVDNQYQDKLTQVTTQNIERLNNKCLRHLSYLQQKRKQGHEPLYRSQFFGLLK